MRIATICSSCTTPGMRGSLAPRWRNVCKFLSCVAVCRPSGLGGTRTIWSLVVSDIGVCGILISLDTSFVPVVCSIVVSCHLWSLERYCHSLSIGSSCLSHSRCLPQNYDNVKIFEQPTSSLFGSAVLLIDSFGCECKLLHVCPLWYPPQAASCCVFLSLPRS